MRRPEVRLRSWASHLSPQLRTCSVIIHGKPLYHVLYMSYFKFATNQLNLCRAILFINIP